jgi:hypothetical protein
MADQVPVLIGTNGMVEHEIYLLPKERPVTLGRSRSCAISFRRCRQYLAAASPARDQDRDFNTVSRKHVRITVKSGFAVLEDLSSNGTTLGEEVLTGSTSVDLTTGPCLIRLGTRETLSLQLMASDDERLKGLSEVMPDGPDEPGEALDPNTLQP